MFRLSQASRFPLNLVRIVGFPKAICLNLGILEDPNWSLLRHLLSTTSSEHVRRLSLTLWVSPPVTPLPPNNAPLDSLNKLTHLNLRDFECTIVEIDFMQDLLKNPFEHITSLGINVRCLLWFDHYQPQKHILSELRLYSEDSELCGWDRCTVHSDPNNLLGDQVVQDRFSRALEAYVGFSKGKLTRVFLELAEDSSGSYFHHPKTSSAPQLDTQPYWVQSLVQHFRALCASGAVEFEYREVNYHNLYPGDILSEFRRSSKKWRPNFQDFARRRKLADFPW